LQEVEWVTSLAQLEPRIQAIVAFSPLEQGEDVRAYLQKLMAYPLVKGVRRLIQSEAQGFCIQPDFVKGVQLLTEFGYSFDICVLHYQLEDVLQLVQQCPEVSFVLDHIGKPNIKTGLFDPWRKQIIALANFPNVSCKISGLATEADWETWTPEILKPYVNQVISAFGPERIMFGGDWPVSTLATTYQNWVETLEGITAVYSNEIQHQLFYQNANSFYKMMG